MKLALIRQNNCTIEGVIGDLKKAPLFNRGHPAPSFLRAFLKSAKMKI